MTQMKAQSLENRDFKPGKWILYVTKTKYPNK